MINNFQIIDNNIKISGKVGGMIIIAKEILKSRGNVIISDGENQILIPRDIVDRIVKANK